MNESDILTIVEALGTVAGLHHCQHAEVAKLVDALASGASGGNPVEVQVLSSAPNLQTIQDHHKPQYTLILKEFSSLISLPVLSVMVPDCPFCGIPVERGWSADHPFLFHP